MAPLRARRGSSEIRPSTDNQGSADQAEHRSWRTTLEDQGITFSVESDTDVFVNASGGIKQRAVVFNWLKLGLNLDVEHANSVARQAGVASAPNLSFESVLEATYAIPITTHWQLQPDLQWVIRPGGSDRFHNALVLGLRSTITF